MTSRAASVPVDPQTPEQIEAAKDYTRRLAVREGLLWSAMWGCGEVYVSPFAIFLKASNHAMAFLGSVIPIIGALAQILGASIIERTGRRRPVMVRGVTVQALSYFVLVAIPFFFPALGVPAVLAISAVTAVFIGMAGPAWSSLMGDVVAESERGRYFARRSRVVILGMLVMLLAAGRFLSYCRARDWTWFGFGLLFVLAGVARLGSRQLMLRHYDAPLHAPEGGGQSFWQFLRGSPRSNFARFTFAVALMTGTTNIAGPFFSVYMLRDLHWSYLQFALCTVVFLVAQFFLVPWWGMLCDRHGNRAVLHATSLILPWLPICWALTHNYHLLLAVQVVSGCAWSGFNLAASNFIYDSVPSPQRARAISYYGVVNGVFSLVGGSLIGAFLAEHLPSAYRFGPVSVTFVSPLPGVFVVSGLLRIVVGVLTLGSFKEVRAATYVSPFHLLWRLTLGEPIIGAFGEVVDRLAEPIRRLTEGRGDEGERESGGSDRSA